MSKSLEIFFFFIYLLFGIYIINLGFDFFSMPLFIVSINKWIVLIAGFLLIFGGILYLKPTKGGFFY
ncbi:hypothetical protein FJZ20_01150 [Candidatus Pacearchaeota archaeon]|nr:hypothetical protein [Candidatus Pacearchaeota archaeon]